MHGAGIDRAAEFKGEEYLVKRAGFRVQTYRKIGAVVDPHGNIGCIGTVLADHTCAVGMSWCFSQVQAFDAPFSCHFNRCSLSLNQQNRRLRQIEKFALIGKAGDSR